MWDDECERAFDSFKQALIHYPILHYPDFELPLLLFIDACDNGLRIVLSLRGPKGERTIAYTSRKLKQNDRNCAVLETEALAIVWGIKYFRQYLF